MQYFFEKKQEIKLEIMDDDGKGDAPDLIGLNITTMGAIMGAKNQMYEKDLEAGGSSKRGKIIVRAEPVETSKFHARFKMVWKNLNNQSGFCCFKEWQNVRFEIGRNIPGTSNFAEIFCSKQFL